LPSELLPLAKGLGNCIAKAPELWTKLRRLLEAQYHHHRADQSNTVEAVVLEAALHLVQQGKDQILAGEIAVEANALLKARGERLSLRPEKIGNTLKKFGRPTRRLGKAGNGLELNRATIDCLHQLAFRYGGGGLEIGENNQHCSFCAQSK